MPRSFFHSLSFRLTGHFAVAFFIAIAVVFTVTYFTLSTLAARRVDTFLHTEMDECVRLYHFQGLQAVVDEATAETRATGTQDLLFRITDSSGIKHFETDNKRFEIPDDILTHRILSTPEDFVVPVESGLGSARLITSPLDSRFSLAIICSMRDDVSLIRGSMRVVLCVALGAGALATAGGYLLSRRTLAPIAVIRDAASDIATGRIDRRVPVSPRGDEVDRLAHSFNTMAARINVLLHNLKDANDQLAHELRSPITHIRGRCELALSHANNSDELFRVASETAAASDRLLGTINTILAIAENEAGAPAMLRTTVRLDTLLADAADLFLPLAQDAQLQFNLHLAPHVTVVGDPPKLQRLFSNLLDNAIKYTPPGGTITLSLTSRDHLAHASIRDTGPGIPPEHLPRIFDRFYRAPQSNGAPAPPGNGLGLALARSIARASGGDIAVASTLGGGAEFTVSLPLAT